MHQKGLHDSAAFLWFPGSTEWLMIREQRGRLPHNPEEPSREGRENPLLDSSLSYSSFFVTAASDDSCMSQHSRNLVCKRFISQLCTSANDYLG